MILAANLRTIKIDLVITNFSMVGFVDEEEEDFEAAGEDGEDAIGTTAMTTNSVTVVAVETIAIIMLGIMTFAAVIVTGVLQIRDLVVLQEGM